MKLKEGETFVDVAGISIDGNDNVYVFNRSTRPMIMFKRPRESFLSADNTIWITDDKSHLAQKFSWEGKLLMTLGNKDRPSDTGYRVGWDRDIFVSDGDGIRHGGPWGTNRTEIQKNTVA